MQIKMFVGVILFSLTSNLSAQDEKLEKSIKTNRQAEFYEYLKNIANRECSGNKTLQQNKFTVERKGSVDQFELKDLAIIFLQAKLGLFFVKFTPLLRRILNISIKNNYYNVVSLLAQSGFLLRDVKGLEFRSVGDNPTNNPLHVLVDSSKEHEDPIYMAKLLILLGADYVACNNFECKNFEQLKANSLNSGQYLYPHQKLAQELNCED